MFIITFLNFILAQQIAGLMFIIFVLVGSFAPPIFWLVDFAELLCLTNHRKEQTATAAAKGICGVTLVDNNKSPIPQQTMEGDSRSAAIVRAINLSCRWRQTSWPQGPWTVGINGMEEELIIVKSPNTSFLIKLALFLFETLSRCRKKTCF